MARWQPPSEQVVEVRKAARWPMVLLLLALLGVAGAGLWIIRLRMQPQRPADLSTAVGVRSEISVAGDSLDVAVFWRLNEAASAAPADSVRIEVGVGSGAEPRILITPNTHNTDTLSIPAPKVGETASGSRGRPARPGSTCGPWPGHRPARSRWIPLPAYPGRAGPRLRRRLRGS
jgi:hypothetical protein